MEQGAAPFAFTMQKSKTSAVGANAANSAIADLPMRSHPERKAMPRMRAAALARLARSRAIALGSMNRRRFRAIQKLGFVGWAGISGGSELERGSDVHGLAVNSLIAQC